MSTDAFNVVVIRPPGFDHAGVFAEVASLLRHSLRTLGHHADIAVNRFVASSVNIVLGYHMLGDAEALRPYRWIPFQLEQLESQPDRREPWLRVLAAASEIWEYDPQNVRHLEAVGIRQTRLLTIGSHPAMRTIPPTVVPPDVDVLHYGTLSPRRKSVLDALHARGCRVISAFGVYAAERDRLIARSKIVLNVHQFDGALYEQVRVSHLLNNGACVVGELAEYDPYVDVLPTVAYDGLADRCVELLADDAARRKFADEATARFAKLSMAAVVAQALS